MRKSLVSWIPWSKYQTKLCYTNKKKIWWNCYCSLTSLLVCLFYLSCPAAALSAMLKSKLYVVLIRNSSHGFFNGNRWGTFTKYSHPHKRNKMFQVKKYSNFYSWKVLHVCTLLMKIIEWIPGIWSPPFRKNWN